MALGLDAVMAQSPRYIDVQTPRGPVRVHITYTRRFTQRVPVEFCFLHTAGISHDCDEWGCWS